MRLSAILRQSRSARDRSQPVPFNPDEPNGQTDDGFDADFAGLVARFATESGGSLSPELATDLALQIVLNEIAEQTCLVTGATGAAIVLQHDGEMICRARSGATAPELGTRLGGAAGLSGECIKTGQTQRCDDVLADPRADMEASQRLGVRSVLIMPLGRENELVGLFELFSSQPAAFGERAEQNLQVLAGRILRTQRCASECLEQHRTKPQVESKVVSEPLRDTLPHGPAQSPENSSQRKADLVTWILGACVLAFTLLLAVQGTRLLGWRSVKARMHPIVAAAATRSVVNGPAPNLGVSGKAKRGDAPATQSTIKPNVGPAVPPGSLQIFENGKEVFHQRPEQNQLASGQPFQKQASGSSLAGQLNGGQRAAVQLSPEEAQSVLLHRVEPEYPEQARQENIQGPVVLDLHIGADGAVQNVEMVSGPAELAQASIAAVKQWRFKPRMDQGRAIEMQTRVTLNFKLQQ